MRLKYEDYTDKTSLVIELSEILTSYTVFTSDSESSFKHRLNLVRSAYLSNLCIQLVFTDGTTKVLILGDEFPYWSENEIKPDFGSSYLSPTRLLEKMKQVVVDCLYSHTSK